MAYQTFHQEYMHIPVVTRVYTTACVLTTTAVVKRHHFLLSTRYTLFYSTQQIEVMG